MKLNFNAAVRRTFNDPRRFGTHPTTHGAPTYSYATIREASIENDGGMPTVAAAGSTSLETL
jgi:hypothetical protein